MDLKYGFRWIENFQSIFISVLLVPVRLIVDFKVSFVLLGVQKSSEL